MRASQGTILHRDMLIAMSLRRDLSSTFGPYCHVCICTEWFTQIRSLVGNNMSNAVRKAEIAQGEVVLS